MPNYVVEIPDQIAYEINCISSGHDLDRIRSLISIYEKLSPPRRGRRPVGSTDILRSAVVLLHAVLENHLRTLGRLRLSRGDETALNLIPLVGRSNSGRAEKFLLGALSSHRDKTVSDLIQESVESYLVHRSFSSTQDIVSLLEACGLTAEPFQRYLPSLSKLIERRHHIVHRADENTEPGRGRRENAKTISRAMVERWLRTVEGFAATVVEVLRSELAMADNA